MHFHLVNLKDKHKFTDLENSYYTEIKIEFVSIYALFLSIERIFNAFFFFPPYSHPLFLTSEWYAGQIVHKTHS